MGKSLISSRRKFTREFKLAAVKEVKSGKPAGLVARRLEVNVNILHRWRRELSKNPTKAFSGLGNKMLADSREAELERKIGQMTMENDFLKKLLRSFEEQREADGGGRPYMRKSAKKASR
jgi:transposase